MKIFVLEDDLIQQERIDKILKELCHKNNIIYNEFYLTSKPENILEKVDIITTQHIYFLDIEIKGHNIKGLELAHEIRKKDPYGSIVFVTSHIELAPRTFAYKVAAIDFIEKDQEEIAFQKRIEECLIIANQHKKAPPPIDIFEFENNYTSFRIPFSDILYFETTEISHKIKLVTLKKTIDFYGKLGDIVTYDHRLFRCHKSFVVNLENVEAIDRKNKILYLQSEFTCLISRRLLKETEKNWHEIKKL